MEGFQVVTAVGEKRVGRIVGADGHYYIVKRSFGRGRHPLPRRQVEVDPERRRVLMRTPRKSCSRLPKSSARASSTRQPTATTAARSEAMGLPIFIVAARRVLTLDRKPKRPPKPAPRKRAEKRTRRAH
jgi:hypothetical protein